ncbi:Protein of unknown function [Pyronema omphalodes CBS 100304]|uniref:Uncharacterized protein n=1 Tax=Pyronema omphalodes (strain CBS 100304) TaxID=1076935 RepID=U4L162_PYROM|nr:Protein of unknown function [Pyronema omphalodes CBS 100304]
MPRSEWKDWVPECVRHPIHGSHRQPSPPSVSQDNHQATGIFAQNSGNADASRTPRTVPACLGPAISLDASVPRHTAAARVEPQNTPTAAIRRSSTSTSSSSKTPPTGRFGYKKSIPGTVQLEELKVALQALSEDSKNNIRTLCLVLKDSQEQVGTVTFVKEPAQFLRSYWLSQVSEDTLTAPGSHQRMNPKCGFETFSRKIT